MKILWKRGVVFVAVALVAAVFVVGQSVRAQAGPVKASEKVKAVMVGDRLVDVAFNLGVLPEGMSVRCSIWPKCIEIRRAAQLLGCPNCVMKKNPKRLAAFMRERGITRLILEKSQPFCIYMKVDPVNAAELVKDVPGVTVEYVDFTKGVPDAIRQTAKLLDRVERGEELVKTYEADMQKAKALLPSAGLGKRVVILNGTYSQATGKIFVRVEAPGGYTDQYILTPLGCTNAAGSMISGSATISKGHVSSRKLAGLLEARPDVIVTTGNAFAVQLALRQAVKANPSLAEIPALKNDAVFTLPFYGDSSVIGYPGIFSQWAAALGVEK